MAVGIITKLDTLKWSDASSSEVAVEVRSGIIAILFEASDVPQCATFSYGADGTLTKLDEQTLTGITYCGIVFSAIKIADGIVAFTYLSSTPSPYAGEVATVAIAADGTITAAVIDVLEFDDDTYESNIVHATGDIYVISFKEETANDAYIATVDIDSSGNIGAAIADSQQLTTGPTTAQSVIKIADGIVAIFYNATATGSRVETRSIAADGTIGAIIDGPDIWLSSGTPYYMHSFSVGGTIYACTFQDAFSDGWVYTFDISADGTITTAGVDSLEYEPTASWRFPRGAAGGGIACFSYSDTNHYGQFKTVAIDSLGNVGASVIDTETFDGTFADYTYIVKITNVLYIVVWKDTNGYGQAASLRVAANLGEGAGAYFVVGEYWGYYDGYGNRRLVKGVIG